MIFIMFSVNEWGDVANLYSHMPGAAMVILDVTTWVIALTAALLELPMYSPLSS